MAIDAAWRSAVGPEHMFFPLGLHQLEILVFLGLKERHTVLDIGAGVFRAGRFITEYTPNYYAVEPEKALVDYGLENVLGAGKVKRTVVSAEFDYSCFGMKFDYVLCHALLTHLDKEDISAFMRGARAALHDESFLLVTFHIDTKTHVIGQKSWTVPLIAHTEEDITKIVSDANMKCTFLGIPHPMGQKWALIRL